MTLWSLSELTYHFLLRLLGQRHSLHPAVAKAPQDDMQQQM